VRPTAIADLSTVRAIGSTGAPLSDADHRWWGREAATTSQIRSISGGTDVCVRRIRAHGRGPHRRALVCFLILAGSTVLDDVAP
jgi:acyl-coenzyme A synthetase/AMP-(fatty) acid ligase